MKILRENYIQYWSLYPDKLSIKGGTRLKIFQTWMVSKHVLPTILFSGTIGQGKPRKKNQKTETKEKSLTQKTVGNFWDDDYGRLQSNNSIAGLKSIRSIHPGVITPMLVNEFKRLFDMLECIKKRFINLAKMFGVELW